MSAEQNKTMVRNYLETSWKKRNWPEAAKFVTADHLIHGPLTDQLPRGPEGNKAFVTGMVTAFPDVKYTIDKQETDDNLVRTWLTYIGTNTGSLMGMPATGKPATVKVKLTDRIANGKIAESWAEWDDKDMMRQLGLG